MYLNERINILNDVKTKTFSNAHFVTTPLLGGVSDTMNDFYGLLVCSSSTQIMFWLITPTQYFHIYSISLHLDNVNPMIKESISSTDPEERKQKLRKYIFVEPDSINWNVGINQNGLENIKISELVKLDLDINNEILVATDVSGNIILFK